MSLLLRLERLLPAFFILGPYHLGDPCQRPRGRCHLTRTTSRHVLGSGLPTLLSGNNEKKKKEATSAQPGLAFTLGLPGIVKPEG